MRNNPVRMLLFKNLVNMSLMLSISRSCSSLGITGLRPYSMTILSNFLIDLNNGISITLSSLRNVSSPMDFAQISASLPSILFKERSKPGYFCCPLNIVSQYLLIIVFAISRFIVNSSIGREESPRNGILYLL